MTTPDTTGIAEPPLLPPSKVALPHGMTITASDVRAHPQINLAMMTALGAANVHNKEEIRYGDYAWPGHPIRIGGPDDNGTIATRTPQIGVELCTIADFCGKITSGRLQYQVNGLLQTYDYAVLMLQGDFRPDADGKVSLYGTRSGIDFARAEAILDSADAHGVHVKYTRNLDHTIRRLVQMYRWWQKDPASHEFFKTMELDQEASGMLVPLDNEFDRTVQAMSALVRGLGESRIEAALSTYPTVSVLTNLTIADLKVIHGWGPKLAKDFYDACNRRWKSRS